MKQNFKKIVVNESLQVVLCLITEVNLTQQNNFSVVSTANLSEEHNFRSQRYVTATSQLLILWIKEVQICLIQN